MHAGLVYGLAFGKTAYSISHTCTHFLFSIYLDSVPGPATKFKTNPRSVSLRIFSSYHIWYLNSIWQNWPFFYYQNTFILWFLHIARFLLSLIPMLTSFILVIKWEISYNHFLAPYFLNSVCFSWKISSLMLYFPYVTVFQMYISESVCSVEFQITISKSLLNILPQKILRKFKLNTCKNKCVIFPKS